RGWRVQLSPRNHYGITTSLSARIRGVIASHIGGKPRIWRYTARPMPSFDVVSKVNLMELDNALNTAAKESAQRYDFRGTNTTIERGPEGIAIRSSDEPHAVAAMSVLRERMAKRNVSQRCLDPKDVEPAGGQTVRQQVGIKQGIEMETAKKIVK